MIEGTTANDFALLKKVLEKAKQNLIERTQQTDLFNQKELDFLLNYIDRLNQQTAKTFDKFLLDDMYKEYIDAFLENNIDVPFKKNEFFELGNENAFKILYDLSTTEFRTALYKTKENFVIELKRLSQQQQNEAITTITAGRLTGKSRQKVQDDLVRYLKAEGLTSVAITTESGKAINYSLEAYSEIIYRRSSTKASLYGAVDTASEMDTDLLKLSSHSNPSPMCKKYQGQIVSISGKNKKYTSLKTAMTWFKGGIGIMNHKYCRHKATPYFEED